MHYGESTFLKRELFEKSTYLRGRETNLGKSTFFEGVHFEESTFLRKSTLGRTVFGRTALSGEHFLRGEQFGETYDFRGEENYAESTLHRRCPAFFCEEGTRRQNDENYAVKFIYDTFSHHS